MKDNSKRILQIVIIFIVILMILLIVLAININKSKTKNNSNTNIINKTLGNSDSNLLDNSVDNSDENSTGDTNSIEGETVEVLPTVYENLSTIQDVCNYLGCTYIDSKNSTEKKYDKDIYINFNTEPAEVEGREYYSNKPFYEDVIINFADKMEDDFRIIDESRSIVITVKLDDDSEQKNATYLINNDPHFFDNAVSKKSLSKIVETQNDVSNLKVKSPIIQSLINNNWQAQLSVQNMQKQEGNYYVYNGYKVRMLGDRVYNIIFDSNYKEEIFDGITTGMDQADLYDKLPDAYYFGTDIATALGYKTNDFYVFFLNGKISIYPTVTLDQNKDEQLNALMTKLNKDGDYSSFIDNITKVYTDYTIYENNNGKIDIKYPLEGFEIKFGYDKNNGITIYDNFQGKIVDNKTLTDIQKDGNIPNNLYILYDNLMFQETYDTLE